jgi:hypothetical protein
MSSAKRTPVPLVPDVTRRNLLFVAGKGGVGKTVVSQAIALSLARSGRRTLWTTFEDPTRPLNLLEPMGPNLWHLNSEATAAFEEYASLKIGAAKLTRIFLQNKLMRYLAKAAPGVHELVLLGKVWYERSHYDHVVVDMPSTGYGLAMFQATSNFSRLFTGGPIHRDAEEMLATFHDPSICGHLVVALPEEMPLRESLELDDFLRALFPGNPAAFLANRRFPAASSAEENERDLPDRWPTPVAASAADYARKRSILEAFNLRLWQEQAIPFGELGYVPPSPDAGAAAIVGHLSEQLQERRYV